MSTKTAEQIAAGLDSHDKSSLALLCERSRPMVGADIARLVTDGLAEFVKETRSGTTWYRATALGRAVHASLWTPPSTTTLKDRGAWP